MKKCDTKSNVEKLKMEPEPVEVTKAEEESKYSAERKSKEESRF